MRLAFVRALIMAPALSAQAPPIATGARLPPAGIYRR
jgi:hypothetical protein